MATRSHSLQPFAWLFKTTLPDSLRYVQARRLPTAIYASLSSLEPVPPKIAPIVSLHDALATFAHSILAFDPQLMDENNPERRWLFATREAEIDPQKLRIFIQKWLIVCYGEERAKLVYSSWNESEIHWAAPEIIDLMTADDQLVRMLLPGLVARYLLDREYQLTLETSAGVEMLPMRLAPLMTRRYTAEIISEPRGERLDHSYVLRFWVDRMPATGEWVLLAKASMRRWMIKPFITPNKKTGGEYVGLAYGRGKSVYLRRASGYLDSQPHQDVFARVTLKWFGDGVSGLNWVGKQAEMFTALHIGGRLPPATDVGRDPAAHRDHVLVTMENKDVDSDSPAPGLQPRDHRRIFDDLAAHLTLFAEPTPLWKRVVLGDWHGIQSPGGKRMKNIASERRRNGLAYLPSVIRIEIHADVGELPTTKRILLTIIGAWDAYQDRLGDDPLVVETEGRRLEIVQGNDPDLTALLPRSDAPNEPYNKSAAIEKRRGEITRRYRKIGEQQTTGMLIMLSNYKNQPGDPKEAIRNGLIRAKCVSQFFTPIASKDEREAYERRIEMAIRDLLRVLGYRLGPYYTKPVKSTLHETVDLIGFWLIQLNVRRKKERMRLFPLVIFADHEDHRLQVLIPNDTGMATRYSTLYEGIIAAASWSFDYTAPQQAVGFFRDALRKCVRPGVPSLLLLVDQKMRRVHPELASQINNSPVSLDHMLEDFPQVRVARLRFSREDEAPFCIPGTPKSRWGGLYAHPYHAHIFYSLHNMINRRQSISTLKLEYPDTPAANPSTVQILVSNLQSDDDPAEWAAAVHRLRRASWHIDDATVLPQPLHDLQQVLDYIPRQIDDVEEMDLNATDLLIERV
ncbi:MAG: DUF3962 domain-containing protein [Anaerolineae bacterium]|nr:DUF3962 domain-containing protein [Anaerolineae bacterium]